MAGGESGWLLHLTLAVMPSPGVAERGGSVEDNAHHWCARTRVQAPRKYKRESGESTFLSGVNVEPYCV